MVTYEDYIARAEALGLYYAQKRRPEHRFGWVNILNDIEYTGNNLVGKGDDGRLAELNIQMNIESACRRAYLREKYRLVKEERLKNKKVYTIFSDDCKEGITCS